MGKLNLKRARNILQEFDFATLFIEELGWDHLRSTENITVDQENFILSAIAEKRGLVVLLCKPENSNPIPPYAVRRKIERQVAKTRHEHLIIYTDNEQTTQIWQWVRREPGKPDACREHQYQKGQPGDALIQKLDQLAVSLDEEESITLVEMAGRTRAAFDVERVTKRFFDRFKKEHSAFLDFIEGIREQTDREWYASLMLNRLMFVYFIQKKGFLDGDTNYLRNRLQVLQEQSGGGSFHSFYRHFLLRLFHEGLGAKPDERKPELDKLLGRIPYLNGGLFDVHELERQHDTIRIPDQAFENLFDFFEQYQWHLDERPLRRDNEINPDVLGYIFEKYINQKQMGAYYTKEDITEYIGKNTIIPYLFDAAEKKCKIAFQGEQSIWKLLQNDPDRYIYDAVKKGCDLPLPPEIEKGVDTTKPDLLERRKEWNSPAPEEYALPTEIWREVMARRRRYTEIREKLVAGELRAINDLITYNLNIRQFAQDVIENCEGPELLRAFWQAIVGRIPSHSNQRLQHGITILDPTCGSGAFLFAALNILEPLYEACLDRMQTFVAELDRSAERPHPEKFSDFRKELDRVKAHPNQRYFIMKSIILNNLYGVDIMAEAVEICKLRLFLKMVAQLERVEEVEPLPDIDFNIRCGNTLVGFVTEDEVRDAITLTGGKQMTLTGMHDAVLQAIEQKARDLQQAFNLFRRRQVEGDGSVPHEDKLELRRRLDTLGDDLNQGLAVKYGINAVTEKEKYEQWLESHQPFHWFIEYYGIMADGGFDVIIGNPPYVEYRKVKNNYHIKPIGYLTTAAKNLYAFCIERSSNLLEREGHFGMIVPSSAVGLANTACLRTHILRRYSITHSSTYSIRPAKLFEGVDQRLCIILAHDHHDITQLCTTSYKHWNKNERCALFELLSYADSIIHKRLNRIAQLGEIHALMVLNRIEEKSDKEVQSYYFGKTGFKAHYHRSPRYWIRAMDFEQYFKSPTRSKSIHHFRNLYFEDKDHGKSLCAILNSSLFFFWFMSICNGRNLTTPDVSNFPVGKLSSETISKLVELFDSLMDDYKDNSLIRKRTDCEYQEFRPSLSKPIIDEIDKVLARHYGFTDEELDFIINYDIKYRMGIR